MKDRESHERTSFVQLEFKRTCHPERTPKERKRPEEESKDRENADSNIAASGSSTETICATIFAVRDGYDYKFWVYILTSRTGTLYVGITGYLDRRISQHKMDSIEGFTKKYKVHRLVFYETYRHVQNAIRREKQLKGWRREKKIALIEKSNPRWQDTRRTLGTGNAVPGTAPRENSLTRHCDDEHPRDPSTRARIHARIAQDDKIERAWTHDERAQLTHA